MITKINKIGQDGLAHILVSNLLTKLLMLFLPFWLSALIVLLIGILKEVIYDKFMKKGTFEWKDIVCDIIGILMEL